MGNSCGGPSAQEKAELKELNRNGIYKAEQIEAQVLKAWKKFNKDKSETVSKDTVKAMTESAVNYLGSIGDGRQFNDGAFEQLYKKIDPKNKQENTQEVVTSLVTYLTSPGTKK